MFFLKVHSFVYKYFIVEGMGYEEHPDVSQLPVAVPRGNFNPVRLSEGKPSVIAFQLETTDLSMYMSYI